MTEIASGAPVQDSETGRRPEAIKAIPVRHPWRWVSAAVVLTFAAYVIYTLATAPHLRWSVVGDYMFQRLVREGALLTVELTLIAMAIGISLGIVLAVMRISPNPVMSWLSWFYIWFFRGTPVLVQIWFWFNLAIVLPRIGVGIPGTNIGWFASTNYLIPPIMAAILGLGLNEAAYMAEIVRAGIISVDLGQSEAAQALGMNRLLVMRRIVLPQAMRVILPPTGNETISMLKTTSLAFVASVPELYERANQIASATFYVIELLIVISIWYLAMTSVASIGQSYLERRFGRGVSGSTPRGPWERLTGSFFGSRASSGSPSTQPSPGTIV
ncbi:MAG: amino acid ABC transporter permease [Candidatus Dormibacterales bacterium]